MAELFPERGEEILWPERFNPGDVPIPGRPEWTRRETDLRPSFYEEFVERRRDLVRQLGSGGRNMPPRDPRTGLIPPKEEPPATEVCAYYKSFRAGAEAGFFLGLSCWFSIARYLHYNGIPDETAVDEAFLKLFRHEFFHFAVDRATVVLERAAMLATGHGATYWLTYHSRNNPSLLEEALANANAFRHAGKSNPAFRSQVQQLIRHWMLSQPAGYRDFEQVLSPAGELGRARTRLLSAIVDVYRGSGNWVRGLDSLVLVPSFTKKTQDCFRVSFEGQPIPLYFF